MLHIALDLALYARSQPQGSGSGPDHGEPVASLVSSRQRCLVVGVGRLNAKGIQRNVLRGRAKGHSQCAPDDGVQGRERVAQRHANQPAHDHQLRQQQPAAPAPQRAREQRQRHAVHQRRPHPLEGIGQGHPAQIANGGAVDACFAQPERERAQHQQQRKPGRKTQGQHAQTGRFGIDLEGRGPGAACGGGSSGGCGRFFRHGAQQKALAIMTSSTAIAGLLRCLIAHCYLQAAVHAARQKAARFWHSMPPCRNRLLPRTACCWC